MYSPCIQKGSLSTNEIIGMASARTHKKINYMGFGFKVGVNYTLIFKQEIFGVLLLQNIRFSYHLPVLLPESHQHPL